MKAKEREEKLIYLFQRLATESKRFKDIMQVISEREGYQFTGIITEFDEKWKNYVDEAKQIYEGAPND